MSHGPADKGHAQQQRPGRDESHAVAATGHLLEDAHESQQASTGVQQQLHTKQRHGHG
jgi:hypothetical protein